jgi:hypothetical protein
MSLGFLEKCASSASVTVIITSVQMREDLSGIDVFPQSVAAIRCLYL